MPDDFLTQPSIKFPAKGAINPLLIGTWELEGTTKHYVIGPNDFYYLVGAFTPYAISADGLELNWDGWIFSRLLGSGLSLIGAWSATDTGEEVYMRADMTFTWHDPSGAEYFGTYATETGPDRLSHTEARAFLIDDGATLTFNKPYDTSITRAYTVDATVLDLIKPDDGAVIRYSRIP